MKKVDEILKERGKKYGSFLDNINNIDAISEFIEVKDDYNIVSKAPSFLIALKLIRLGYIGKDFDYHCTKCFMERLKDEDSFIDLIGYIRLIVENRLSINFKEHKKIGQHYTLLKIAKKIYKRELKRQKDLERILQND